MALIKDMNYAFNASGLNAVLQSGDIIEDSNLAQKLPDTIIGSGLTGLTIRNCNCLNCSFPTDTVFENCLRIQKDFCANIPENASLNLDAEPENCRHVVSTTPVYVNGFLVDTVYIYQDTVL